MKWFVWNSLWLVMAWLACTSLLQAEDAVRYLDRKTMKETILSTGNVVEESPTLVVYRPAGAASKEIPAPDIIDITYEVPGSVRLVYRSALADERKLADPAAKDEERKKASNDALKSYQEVLARLAGEKGRFAERHVHYKIARLQARQALDDPAQVEEAIVSLVKFKKEHPDGWQIVPCARLLAQLYLIKGDIQGARKVYEELAATPNIPKEVREDCDLRIIETLILAKQFAEAQSRVQALRKTAPANDPQAARLLVYEAECLGASGKLPEAVAQLEDIIGKTSDKDLKALAYNSLGDCYRLNGRPREALWPYLWVDVIYHQDRHEHAKAMTELAKLFTEQGDTARAKEYRDKLKREAW
jgi:tetratricopeptide (TPR) repeat protein